MCKGKQQYRNKTFSVHARRPHLYVRRLHDFSLVCFLYQELVSVQVRLFLKFHWDFFQFSSYNHKTTFQNYLCTSAIAGISFHLVHGEYTAYFQLNTQHSKLNVVNPDGQQYPSLKCKVHHAQLHK